MRGQDGRFLHRRLIVKRGRTCEIKTVIFPVEGLRHIRDDHAVKGAIFKTNVIGIGFIGVRFVGVDIENSLKGAVAEQGMAVHAQQGVADGLILIHMPGIGGAAGITGLGVITSGVGEVFHHLGGSGGNSREAGGIIVGIIVGNTHAGHIITGLAVVDAFMLALDFVFGADHAIAVLIKDGIAVLIEGFQLPCGGDAIFLTDDGVDGSLHDGVAGDVEG